MVSEVPHLTLLLRLLSATALPQKIHRWRLQADLDPPTVSAYGERLPKGSPDLPRPVLSNHMLQMLPSLHGVLLSAHLASADSTAQLRMVDGEHIP